MYVHILQLQINRFFCKRQCTVIFCHKLIKGKITILISQMINLAQFHSEHQHLCVFDVFVFDEFPE